MGSGKALIIDYKIENFGETAFLTKLNISFPGSLSLIKLPAACETESNNNLICDINDKSPLFNNKFAYFKLTLNTTKLYGKKVYIMASVMSAGKDSNEMDNIFSTMITLAESSQIEILGYVVRFHFY